MSSIRYFVTCIVLLLAIDVIVGVTSPGSVAAAVCLLSLVLFTVIFCLVTDLNNFESKKMFDEEIAKLKASSN